MVKVGFHTSVLEVGSRVAPQAFMLYNHQRPKISQGNTCMIVSLTQMGH